MSDLDVETVTHGIPRLVCAADAFGTWTDVEHDRLLRDQRARGVDVRLVLTR